MTSSAASPAEPVAQLGLALGAACETERTLLLLALLKRVPPRPPALERLIGKFDPVARDYRNRTLGSAGSPPKTVTARVVTFIPSIRPAVNG